MISSGSWAAASVGGGGLEIHQLLRPAAGYQNWRPFSTGGREPADEAGSVLRMWWERARDLVENADSAQKSKAVFAYGMFVIGAPTLYMLNLTKKWV